MTTPNRPALPIRTTCAYCGVGCGLLITPDGRGGASVAGDPEHPANFGRTCSKGSALDGTLARVSWDGALDRVANAFKDIVERHGPNAIAFYLSGQLLTEDYYVANK